MVKKVAKRTRRKNNLETNYRRFFHPITIAGMKESQHSLAQPHVLKIVRNVVTYAAYEDPV